MGYAEELMAQEGGDEEIIIAAAILHDIGIHAADKKHGSTAGKFQEIEGPPIANEILTKIKFPRAKINEVLDIIAHHHTPGKIDTLNYNILTDADWLVNIKDEVGVGDKEKLEKVINKVFRTRSGSKLARSIYLGS